MLVLLRLNIGWHFFSEGVKHYSDPNWSSENFLRTATGPLAPRFQSVLPDFHIVSGLKAKGDINSINDWIAQVVDDWSAEASRFADFYQLDKDQRAAVNKALERRLLQVNAWKRDHHEDFETHAYDRVQLIEAKAKPTAEAVPFEKKRNADKATTLNADVAAWVSDLQRLENEFQRELDLLLTSEQRLKGSVPQEKSTLATVDTVMTYGILGIGACLILGLLTRLACLLGAAFLLSVVLTQPFWISDAQPTFNQWVELVALLALATTNVGKWGGLDFFIGCIFGKCCGGKCEVPNPKTGN